MEKDQYQIKRNPYRTTVTAEERRAGSMENTYQCI
jgi:hypothetical protein